MSPRSIAAGYPLKRLKLTTRGLSSVVTRTREKPYYITTPIFYPNADPHLGHLYSIVLADIYARYSRLKTPSLPVVLVTGTDEHGQKIQKAAKLGGLEANEQEFCNKISARFQDLALKANTSHTSFVRTTKPEHVSAVQHLWRQLEAGGFLYKGTHKGWYSVSDECFYTDSQVHSLKRQHQTDMVSKETGNVVEWSEEENYKFRLSAFREPLLQRYSANPTSIIPQSQLDAILKLLDMPDNVADISVSRPSTRLSWGIQVPNDPHQTIYVWLDALSAYLSGVGYPWERGTQESFSSGWPPDIQVIGKDILRFHAIYFPAFLMALDLPLPRMIVSHAHLTVNKEKMSKSVGNVANPFAILENYGTDVVRYYLSRIGGRYSADKDWSESQLRKYQGELFSLLGNLLTRAFSHRVVGRLPTSAQSISIKPEIFSQGNPRFEDLHSSLKSVKEAYLDHMDDLRISHALEAIVECLRIANRDYTIVAPWLNTTNVADTALLLSYVRETLRICGILLQPFIPSKAQLLFKALGVPGTRRTLGDAEIGKGQLSDEPTVAMRPLKLFPTHVRY